MGEWKLGAMMLGNSERMETTGRDPVCQHVAQHSCREWPVQLPCLHRKGHKGCAIESQLPGDLNIGS